MQKKRSVDLGQRESRANILLVATIKCTTFSLLLFVAEISISIPYLLSSPSQIFAFILTLLSHLTNKRTPARFAATPLSLSLLFLLVGQGRNLQRGQSCLGGHCKKFCVQGTCCLKILCLFYFPWSFFFHSILYGEPSHALHMNNFYETYIENSN